MDSWQMISTGAICGVTMSSRRTSRLPSRLPRNDVATRPQLHFLAGEFAERAELRKSSLPLPSPTSA